ncbi:unnamed protein product [Brassica rapa subsp. narinosa]|uniref:(rape) hypothetical protein n=1 Tax=Brassica napus TaxID=3708 RepID=A0A816UGE9_BRANA|nr:probable E3 ubiquitin ligase SUD1 [Brassica napus]CAF2102114.1 unnamed protein product [Brassica napus]
MLMLAALSLFLVSTAFMTLPIVVGRVFSYSISFILRRFGITHDEFAFDHILTGRTDLQLIFTFWTISTLLTPIKCFATNAWRRKFKRIKNVGINKLPSMWMLRDVIGSIINTLLTTLSIPYVLVKSLLPLLGYSQSFNAVIELFIWPASLALIVVWFITKL